MLISPQKTAITRAKLSQYYDVTVDCDFCCLYRLLLQQLLPTVYQMLGEFSIHLLAGQWWHAG